MNELAKHTTLPLATNMVVTSFEELKQSVRYPGRGPVQVVLSDHHYWGGLRATKRSRASARPSGLACPCTPTPTSRPA